MTQPLHPTGPDKTPGGAGDGALRDKLLRDMLGNCLPLVHVDSVVTRLYSTNSIAARQAQLTATVASLLTEGLVVIGDIIGASDERVEPWKVPLEEAMARLRER